jgi:hypothetical protein
MPQTVLETRTGWMIRCRCQTNGWHEFPKVGKPNATWTFNGNLEKPTFAPSMNTCCNPMDSPLHQEGIPTTRCHFVVTDGRIAYQGDCTKLASQTMELEPWSDTEVKYYAALKLAEGW